MSDLKFNEPLVKIDKPHNPWGQHVDHVQAIKGIGADKMRFDGNGNLLSHDLNLKGGGKIDLLK